ncbi:SMI1/KNR4 family protein [Nocardia sp. NPDC058499]|uniref:SMI1/KNR4 family protein n=1 Tax=Nocardia sp. NPDC058499 TaxID=3346530 RepID=UPI0036540FEA
MHPLLTRLDRWLAVNRPAYYAGLAPGASTADIDELARAAGGEVPPPLRELLTWRNGQSGDYDGCLESLWFLMSAREIADTMEDMVWVKETEGFEELWWGPGWVPFLGNIYGDHLCIDLQGAFDGKPGQLIEIPSKSESRDIRYPSLEAWLETFVIALETGMFEEADKGYRPGCWAPIDDEEYAALIAGRYPGYPIEAEVPYFPDDIEDEASSGSAEKRHHEAPVQAVDLDNLHAVLRGAGLVDAVVDDAFDRLRQGPAAHSKNAGEE